MGGRIAKGGPPISPAGGGGAGRADRHRLIASGDREDFISLSAPEKPC